MLLILFLGFVLFILTIFFTKKILDLIDTHSEHYILEYAIESRNKMYLRYIGTGIPECYVSHGDLIYADLLLNVNKQIVVKTVLYTFTYNNEKAFFKDWSFY